MKASLSLTIIGLLLIQTFAYSQEDPWQKVEFGGELPPLRYPTATHEPGWGYMLLYGGQSAIDNFYNPDVWVFDFEEGTWVQAPLPQEHPAARAKHAATGIDGKLYVFGGETADGTTTDAWAYDPLANTWEQQPFAQDGTYEENPKHYHRACAGESNIWITGGLDLTTGQATGAIWGYNPLTETWTKGADCPSPRYGHIAYYNDGKVIITGGRQGNNLLDDSWEYEVAENIWVQGNRPPLPEPTKFPAYDYNNEILFAAGGYIQDEEGYFEASTGCYSTDEVEFTWHTHTPSPASLTELELALMPSVNKKEGNMEDFSALVYGIADDGNGNYIGETWIYNSAYDPLVGYSESLQKSDFKIYPTITSGDITISSKTNLQQIEVYNLQGQLILQQRTNDAELSINLRGNVKGSYFIRVRTNKAYSISKVMLF